MSFDTYAQLQAEIRSFLWDRADVVDKIPSFIHLAEGEMRRLLRTRQVNGRHSFTVSSETASLPNENGTILSIRIDDGGEGATRDLDYVSPEQWATFSAPGSTGRPRFYTVQNNRIFFYPKAAETYYGHIVYVEEFSSLSDTCPCNWVLKHHPDIYLCGALKWAKAWLIDSDQDWQTPFLRGIEAANRDSPRVQMNSTLRADEATIMGARRRRFDIMSGDYR